MRVALLGGLEVCDDDERGIAIAGAKLRALLAMLALHVGRVVPADQLIDSLWGEAPPAGARNSLQGMVSKLRRVLGSGDLVAMRGSGYALELPVESVDVGRFEQLVARGRSVALDGDLASAVTALTEADSLWRGDALADFAYEEFAAVAIARLAELRVAALEERLDLELQLGRHQAAVVDLEALVAAHPLRDRPRGLLMTALYRAGRQADALATFHDGRRRMVDELGLEPGADLRRLEAAILTQDPTLDWPGEATTPVPRPTTPLSTDPTIPGSLNQLIGRDEAVRDLVALLADSRLVTLVGPGGVGKTQLALEAARIVSATMAYGGRFVELAPVRDPAQVRTAIAAALDVPDPARLGEMIGRRELLILLDNCEHVIATAAEVVEDLVRRCPGLRILATSREGLRVAGEVIRLVPPLAADDAVRLFTERARAAGATLELTDDGLAGIAGVCARLDGLPLAIELAAARTRVFPIQQILERLDDRFRLLTGGSRTALARQQTLRAVVDWSYELLFDDEQRVFERLSAFPGGCDLATGATVCADEVLAAEDVDDIVQALVDKSLVVAVRTGDDQRFTQLETLAQYARDKLAERGEAGRGPRCDDGALRRVVRAEHRGLRRRAPGPVADGHEPRARQHQGSVRMGRRTAGRRDRADDRRRRRLASLALGVGARGQAVARPGLRLWRRVESSDAGVGLGRPGIAQLPVRCGRACGCGPAHRARHLRRGRRCRLHGDDPFVRSRLRWRPSAPTSTRPDGAAPPC